MEGWVRQTDRWNEARWSGMRYMSRDYLAGIPHGMMIGKVHELVDKIWLIQVACQRAELFVSGQGVTARNNGHGEEVDREAK